MECYSGMIEPADARNLFRMIVVTDAPVRGTCDCLPVCPPRARVLLLKKSQRKTNCMVSYNGDWKSVIIVI